MNDSSAPRFLRADDAEFESDPGRAINRLYLADEKTVVSELLALARPPDAAREAIRQEAVALVVSARARREGKTGIESFLQQYGLASQEGVVLMCLAEALLRIPDADTADKLIADKIAIGQWSDYLGEADSLFVNASTWGLMLTGKLVRESELESRDPVSFLRRLVARLGEPVVRTAFRHAMRIMGRQFVMGRDIGEALERAESDEGARYRHTYDMLGESALTEGDAARYLDAYRAAIEAVGRSVRPGSPPAGWPSVSVKLSALHPRYEYARARQVLAELGPRLEMLALAAKSAGIALTVDAEEAERLELSLQLLDLLLQSPALAGWDGLGLAVQAYSKRAPDVLRFLQRRADATSRVLNLRLVKGAYWDSEVKRAQERGLPGYPVYTRKANTDVAYLACARILLEGTRRIYPQFATHNAHTAASIIHLARANGREFEFQRLHGMGEELHGELTDPAGRALPCRVYAPVGSHEELLPYLVRRLLENGANTSFVNRIVDESLPVADVVGDPIADVEHAASGPHPRIPLPSGLFGAERRNSAGVNLPDGDAQRRLAAGCRAALAQRLRAGPIVGGEEQGGDARECRSPADLKRIVGEATDADAALAERAIGLAAAAQPGWDRVPAATRGADVAGRGGSPRTRHRTIRRDLRRRSRQDRPRLDRRSARGRRLPALLRGACRGRFRPAAGAARADGRVEPAGVAGPRCVRLHQPLELPARHLHRPGIGGACSRQQRDRKARRADAAGGCRDGPAAACGRHPGRRPAPRARARLAHRSRADRRSARRGRRIHRLDRHGAAHQPLARRPRWPARRC